MDIRLGYNHLIYSILISRYLVMIFKIVIPAYFNILDITAKYLNSDSEYPVFSVHLVYSVLISKIEIC